MRPAGLLAAGAIHALRHNQGRLTEDHRRAARLALLAGSVDGLHAARPETNIVMIDVDPAFDPEAVLSAARGRGVWLTRFGPHRLRAVTHLDVDDVGIERAGTALAEALGDLDAGSSRRQREVRRGE